MPTSPFGYARKLIKNGAAKQNAAQTTPDKKLALHDIITLKESNTTAGHLTSTRPHLDILYEDSLILIANKPPGLPMHRTAEFEDNLVEVAQAYMIQRATPCKLDPINRLDRGTSGAVILAKSSSSAAIYGRQVKETGLNKLYLALVHGIPGENGVISEPLDGKASETRYKILLSGEESSLLAVTPISGRMHQIRRHLNVIGHPIVGDKRYNGGEMPELSGFALHSLRTSLILDESGELTVCAPLSEEMMILCTRKGIDRDLLLETVYQLV